MTKVESELTREMGNEWITADPETIAECMDGGSMNSTDMRDKVGALKVLRSTDAFWEDPVVFEKIVLTINDATPVFGREQEYPLSYLVYAVEWVGQKEKYHPDVLRYIAGRFVFAGLYYNPWMSVVNDYILEIVRNKESVEKMIDILKQYFHEKDTGILRQNERIQLQRIARIKAYLDYRAAKDGKDDGGG